MPHTYYHRSYNGGVGDVLGYSTCSYEGQTETDPVYSRAYLGIGYNTEGMTEHQCEKLEKMIEKFKDKFYEEVQVGDEVIHAGY